MFDLETFDFISDLDGLSRSLNNALLFSKCTDTDLNGIPQGIDELYWCVVHDSDVNASGMNWHFCKTHYCCPSPIDDFNNRRYSFTSGGEEYILFAEIDDNLSEIVIKAYESGFEECDRKSWDSFLNEYIIIYVDVDGWIRCI